MRHEKQPRVYADPELGLRIKKAREKSGLSLRKIGDALGISDSAVAQWESGKTFPSRRNLLSFASAAHCDFIWLMTGLEWQHSNKAQPRPVPLLTIDAALEAPLLAWDEVHSREGIQTHFPCGPKAFALYALDWQSHRSINCGDILVMDPLMLPKCGDIVLATLSEITAPVLGKYKRISQPPKTAADLKLIDASKSLIETLNTAREHAGKPKPSGCPPVSPHDPRRTEITQLLSEVVNELRMFQETRQQFTLHVDRPAQVLSTEQHDIRIVAVVTEQLRGRGCTSEISNLNKPPAISEPPHKEAP